MSIPVAQGGCRILICQRFPTFDKPPTVAWKITETFDEFIIFASSDNPNGWSVSLLAYDVSDPISSHNTVAVCAPATATVGMVAAVWVAAPLVSGNFDNPSFIKENIDVTGPENSTGPKAKPINVCVLAREATANE